MPWYVRPVGVTAAGTVVVYANPEGASSVGSAPIWGFHVPTGEWQHYPAPGVEVFDHCLAGDAIVVSTGVENWGVDPNVTGVNLRIIPVGGDSEGWGSPYPVIDQAWDYEPYLGCADGVVVMWGDARHAAGVDDQPAYRLSPRRGAAWEQVASLPADFLFTQDVAAGETLVLFGDYGAAFALEGSSWTPLDTEPWSVGATQVWDGDQVVIVDPGSSDPISSVEVPG